ncbi:unnamed protein product [Microthlaspi erraticum]|uniref:Aspartic peptidase DDI1-type domain-containing protein n=1 Tax=Microthlaspi erraticum TaxID=1685480 RepID=A0A6D2HYS6_9BRAS|nr:unnamed protein product [Microthlaspi erraticum]
MRKAQQDREPQPRASIGDKDNPHTFYQNRSAIFPPNVQRQDFEIKPGMIGLVKDNIFHGLPAEIPVDHIQNFEEICNTTGSNGVPADFLKCKLFPFSLANKASRWLNNGDFMTKSKEGAFELIENLAVSSSNKNTEYGRTLSTVSVKGSSANAKKIEELTAKVNLLMKAQQKSVHFVDENDDTPISQEFGGEEDGQAFVPNRGSNSNYRNHPNMSYRSTNVENPQDQVYPPRSNQNQQSYQKSYPNIFQEKTFAPNQNRSQGGNQQKAQFSNQQQPSGSSNNSNDELKGMMQQMLMNQQKSTAETHLKIDTMYNDLNGKYEAVWTHVKKLDVQVAQTAEGVKRPHGTLPGKGEQNPWNEYVAQVELRSGRKLLPAAIPPKRPGKEKVDKKPILESDLPTPVATETAPARAYTPKVPYPVPRKKSRKDLEEAKCKEKLNDLTVKLTLSDAVQMIPTLKKYMKELISGKVAEEENVMLVSEECSAVLQNKVIKKRSDPGRFVLSMQIGHMIFACSLCDLGSSVNLMPYSVAKRLGYTKFKPTKVSLVFADRSTKFLVAGAIIDVKGGIIDLHLGDIVMRFEMNKLLKKLMLDGQNYVIEDGSNLVDELSLVIAVV